MLAASLAAEPVLSLFNGLEPKWLQKDFGSQPQRGLAISWFLVVLTPWCFDGLESPCGWPGFSHNFDLARGGLPCRLQLLGLSCVGCNFPAKFAAPCCFWRSVLAWPAGPGLGWLRGRAWAAVSGVPRRRALGACRVAGCGARGTSSAIGCRCCVGPVGSPVGSLAAWFQVGWSPFGGVLVMF